MKLNIKERISKATDAVLDFNARKAGRALAYPVTAPISALKKSREKAHQEAQEKLTISMAQAMINAMNATGTPFMEQAHDVTRAHTNEEIQDVIEATKNVNS